MQKKKIPEVDFKIGDIRKWKPIESVDCFLIIDCLTEFNSEAVFNIIKHIKTYINKGGYLIITYTLSNRYIYPSKESAIHKRVLTFKDELTMSMPLDTYLE